MDDPYKEQKKTLKDIASLLAASGVTRLRAQELIEAAAPESLLDDESWIAWYGALYDLAARGVFQKTKHRGLVYYELTPPFAICLQAIRRRQPVAAPGPRKDQFAELCAMTRRGFSDLAKRVEKVEEELEWLRPLPVELRRLRRELDIGLPELKRLVRQIRKDTEELKRHVKSFAAREAEREATRTAVLALLSDANTDAKEGESP